MRIGLDEQIGGLPAGKIRDFLRRSHGDRWGKEFARRALRADAATADRVVAELESRGFAKRIILGGEQVWQNTVRVNGFGQAVAAKPLWRETAEKRLKEFLARVAGVRTADFAYEVKPVIVFGSYLTSQKRINDIDLDQAGWPQDEVRHYLKARSRSLSLHGLDDGILKRCKHKVIYQDDA